MNAIEIIQRWYLSQCDGDWEHSYGIRIFTIDNPGWGVTVDLHDTVMNGVPFATIFIERSDSNWIHCVVKAGQFQGHGGPENLIEVLETFAAWCGTVEEL